MKVHTLDDRLLLPGSLEEVFRFFEDPGNLARITPPSMGFEIVTADREMRQGLEIEYRVRVFGLRMPWKSLITSYRPPFEFTDEALVSPYRLWRHTHRFADAGNGTVSVSDHVDYALPLYPLGELAHFAVRRQLEYIFRYRGQMLQSLLQSLLGASESRKV